MTFEEAKQKRKEEEKQQKFSKKKQNRLIRKRAKLKRNLCRKISCRDCPFGNNPHCVVFGNSSDFSPVENWMKTSSPSPTDSSSPDADDKEQKSEEHKFESPWYGDRGSSRLIARPRVSNYINLGNLGK